MTKFVHNENSGSLFRNTKKQHERQPDYTGQVNVGGELYWVSGWIKSSRNGNRFMSLAVNPVDDSRAATRSTPSESHDYDDDVPF